MKKLIFLFLLISVVGMEAYSQDSGAQILFAKELHNFGTLSQGDNTSCEFVFTNTGNETLVIASVDVSCSCISTTWPQSTIAPGESNAIHVTYDNQRPGPINKSISITSNATNSPTKTVKIKGHINATAPNTGSPSNPNLPGGGGL